MSHESKFIQSAISLRGKREVETTGTAARIDRIHYRHTSVNYNKYICRPLNILLNFKTLMNYWYQTIYIYLILKLDKITP